MMDAASLAGLSIAQIERLSTLPPLETRILLCHALGLSRVQLITRSEQVPDAAQRELLAQLLLRRQAGEPIAYLTGSREFYGLEFRVTPAVLIPRPETELLVELAIERLPEGGSLLDLGTGSGAIAVAIAHARPDAHLTALDASAAALEVARGNAERHGVRVEFLQSDWYAALPAMRFDLVVSNPPYIVAGDTHLAQGDLRFEPVDALTDHADGLSALRTIVSGASAHLADGGWLLMEHGYDQAEAVRSLLAARGFAEVQSWRDLAGIERASGGRLVA
ncbi:peptide chain release factor N(5)-glutamine methyltransferase [Noviherbaspirillum pedocola]|uniref:Release factor glutamine methyltransferase n=1 Tax=Noviherbaspirillum pedocola TaxID=2801341 RepID=A0A934SQQ4_9BURK|nr:peptide chain release factor N(5)-glutamine methyltransferase [Noviherbaspirillum pedocola]MBK4733762.1 peptide chain release factor N(5)-glutamine methyltransferase [Noviherbaspirillum pedocola]